MGKNHRHKKALKADKAKVKLKQTKTKFLPKGQNVTNTQFKIKPIVLIQQLKVKDGDSPLSKRKLDIKDLLSRLRHYNENIRHLACVELSDMIKSHSEEITTQYLSQVILGVSSLMQDKEAKVREAVVKAIKAILEVIPEGKLEPFYNYFVINLCCAMTNINPNIQENSLKYLNCFINKNIDGGCGLITKYSEKILPELLALISKLRADPKSGRTLTVNLGSNLSTLSWKTKVLIALVDILKNVAQSNISETNDQVSSLLYVDDSSTVNWFGLYKKGFGRTLENSNWDWNSINECQKNSSDVLESNILTIIPLLYETWLEVMPQIEDVQSENDSTPLDSEAAAILTCILQTLSLLGKYASSHNLEDKIFKTKECEKLFDSLLLNFPYYSKDSKTVNMLSSNNHFGLLETNASQGFILLNIQLSFLYVLKVFLCKKSVPYEKELKIFSYINKCLLRKKLCKKVVHLLTALIKHCFLVWKKSNSELIKIAEKAINIYESNNDKEISSNLQYFSIFLHTEKN